MQVPLRMRASEAAQDVQYDGEREHVAQDESHAWQLFPSIETIMPSGQVSTHDPLIK